MSSMVCVVNLLNSSRRKEPKPDAQSSYPKPGAPTTRLIQKKNTWSPQQGSPSKSSEK